MSRIFDELRKFKGSKPEPPPPEKVQPQKVSPPPTESLKRQFAPKLEKPKSRRRLLIIALSIGGVVAIGVAVFLLPQFLFAKKPKKKEPPPRLTLPGSRQNCPGPEEEKASIEGRNCSPSQET